MQTSTGSAPLGFGTQFTSHLVTARWNHGSWSPPTLSDHRPLSISPAALALHYGQAIFEGLKAYRQPDGTVALFRPRDNATRFARSATRLAMPPLPVEVFVEACELVVRADHDRVPGELGQSLYLRPLMFATEAALGVRAAEEYMFLVLASPVEHFFEAGTDAIDVWCSDDQVRAARGGTGEAKCAGNYAGSLAAKAEAARHGCADVLFLDAVERLWLEELSAMNVFAVIDGAEAPELVTPPLDGTILHGNTRASLIEIGPDLGYRVAQRRIALSDLTDPDSRVVEMFGCGTAATISPIAAVVHNGRRFPIGAGRSGPVAVELRDHLLGIQYGHRPDRHAWMHTVRQHGAVSTA